MKILLIIRAFFFIGIKKASVTENPKGPNSDSKSIKPTNYKNNPIKTLTFEGGSKKPVCKVLFNEYYDGDLILYRSSSPNDASSYTIDRIISRKDIKNEGKMVRKFNLDNFSQDDKKYTYCVAVSTGSGKKDTHYSEPFQFCESQNKFMLAREAKTHKSTHRAAWVALGLAIAALALVLLVIAYKFFC